MRSDRFRAALEQRPGSTLSWLLLLALATRLLAFPINEHIYGDAIARTELAERWAADPHLITAFGDGAAQFGPLHLYLIAAALAWIDRDIAARLVSLVFGVLTVVPLFALTRHYFGPRSAAVAGAAFALWGLHIQASTTGGSEAIGLFLMWVVFAWIARTLYRPGWLPTTVAAVAMTLAGATRYDTWMYIPLLGVLLAWPSRHRGAGLRMGVLFVLLSLVFPVSWMAGNAAWHGDPFYPLTYINDYHAAWAQQTSPSLWKDVWLRFQGIGFWPAVALFTLTPGVAVLGALGMTSSWKTRPPTRWLVLAAALPTIYYVFRITVRADFVPLGRFAIVQVSLLLPFVGPGVAWLAGRVSLLTLGRIGWTSTALAVVMPIALGVFTWRSESTAAVVLAPVSPVAVNPRELMRAADFLRDRDDAASTTVAIDADARYRDLTVAFYGRLDEQRDIRVRWPDFEIRLELTPADYVVVFDDGRLTGEPWAQDMGETLALFGASYRLVFRDRVVRIFRHDQGTGSATASVDRSLQIAGSLRILAASGRRFRLRAQLPGPLPDSRVHP